jgi:hypothetical protein
MPSKVLGSPADSRQTGSQGEDSMKDVLRKIDELAEQFEALPLFQVLDGPGDRADIGIMVPEVTFFVMRQRRRWAVQ